MYFIEKLWQTRKMYECISLIPNLVINLVHLNLKYSWLSPSKLKSVKRQKKLTSTRCKCESFAKNPQNKNCSSTESWQLQIFKKLTLLRCYFVIIFLRQLKNDMQNFFEMNNFHEFFKLLFVAFSINLQQLFCNSVLVSQQFLSVKQVQPVSNWETDKSSKQHCCSLQK